jgi:hypothetical protein
MKQWIDSNIFVPNDYSFSFLFFGKLYSSDNEKSDILRVYVSFGLPVRVILRIQAIVFVFQS